MADINKVVIVGRLTRNIELKYTNSGTACGKIGVAVNRRIKKNDQWLDEASFFDVTIWGKVAEALQSYLITGKQVGIDGELRQSRWEKDGQQRSRVEIVAHNIQLLGGKSESGRQQSQPQKAADNQENQASGWSQGGSFEDDIPF